MLSLAKVDLEQHLTADEYKRRLAPLQVRMHRLAHRVYRQRKSIVAVFEGWDAAGKGGAIRRITEKVDPRGYRVYPIAAPSGDDAEHHYLWRFWRRLVPPREKQILIFDRSWYGRVLVERIEGFATPDEWRRAYREIREFEGQLTDAGMLVVKYWVHISKDEQKRRFEARRETRHKAWKLTDEDWRNRDRWELYAEAVDDMLLETHSESAPWKILAGNDKRFARIEALEDLTERLTRFVGEPEARRKRSNAKRKASARRGKSRAPKSAGQTKKKTRTGDAR